MRLCLPVSDFDRYSLTIARWLTNVYDADDPAGKPTTPGDVTVAAVVSSDQSFGGDDIREVLRQIELRFLDRMQGVYALFNQLFHRRMRPGTSEQDLAIVIASIVEGLVERRQLIPGKIDRLRLTPIEDDEPHEWHLAALSVYGVYVTMTEDIDEVDT